MAFFDLLTCAVRNVYGQFHFFGLPGSCYCGQPLVSGVYGDVLRQSSFFIFCTPKTCQAFFAKQALFFIGYEQLQLKKRGEAGIIAAKTWPSGKFNLSPKG